MSDSHEGMRIVIAGGSGYSEVWIRDLNTLIDRLSTALHEMERSSLPTDPTNR